jgi:uncharacterized protein (DUF305 family)
MHKGKSEATPHVGKDASHSASHTKHMHYYHLLIMAVLSFMAMYALMYAMVNTFENVYLNFNQFYMAGLMAAPMVLIELAVMRSMYEDSRLNWIVAAVSVLALIAFWVMIRQQTAITDRQFLKSMIPHHAGAILMCEQAPIQDAQIKDLCRNIISSQQSEIDEMKRMLNSLD